MSVINLADRRPPVSYTVRITHHWDDALEVFVEDVADDERSRQSVADALARAACMFANRTDKRLICDCDELRAENARLCAQIAEYFAEPATHPVEET